MFQLPWLALLPPPQENMILIRRSGLTSRVLGLLSPCNRLVYRSVHLGSAVAFYLATARGLAVKLSQRTQHVLLRKQAT